MAEEKDSVSLLNAHVSIINSERNAIWQRFGALFVANSLILLLHEKTFIKFNLSFIGLFICIAWAVSHVHGYILLYRQVDEAAKLPVGNNPIKARPPCKFLVDGIYITSCVVIGAIMRIYLRLLT